MGRSMHIPTRTCVGCRRRDRKSALVRIARSGARPRVDVHRRFGGRGAYLHGECVGLESVRSGLARALRLRVDQAAAGTLCQEITQLLHGADVVSFFEEVSRKGVAQ